MADLALLADALTIFLAPALPYLMKAGGSAAEQLGEKLGGGVWEKAKALWGHVEPKVEEKEAAREAAADVAASPDDADARVALRRQLRKILESDGSLAAEVAKLLDEAGAGPRYHAELHGSGAIAQGRGAVAAGQGGVAVGGDVSGSVIVGGEGRNSRGEPQ